MSEFTLNASQPAGIATSPLFDTAAEAKKFRGSLAAKDQTPFVPAFWGRKAFDLIPGAKPVIGKDCQHLLMAIDFAQGIVVTNTFRAYDIVKCQTDDGEKFVVPFIADFECYQPELDASYDPLWVARRFDDRKAAAAWYQKNQDKLQDTARFVPVAIGSDVWTMRGLEALDPNQAVSANLNAGIELGGQPYEDTVLLHEEDDGKVVLYFSCDVSFATAPAESTTEHTPIAALDSKGG